jgi:hypothetical protein
LDRQTLSQARKSAPLAKRFLVVMMIGRGRQLPQLRHLKNVIRLVKLNMTLPLMFRTA